MWEKALGSLLHWKGKRLIQQFSYLAESGTKGTFIWFCHRLVTFARGFVT